MAPIPGGCPKEIQTPQSTHMLQRLPVVGEQPGKASPAIPSWKPFIPHPTLWSCRLDGTGKRKTTDFAENIMEACNGNSNNTTNNNINNNTGRYLSSAYYVLNTAFNGLHVPIQLILRITP